jgi:hypothetical protein
MTDVVVTHEMLIARQFHALPLEQRLADVCRSCGLHMLSDLEERMQAILEKRSYRCPACNAEKGAFDGDQAQNQEA